MLGTIGYLIFNCTFVPVLLFVFYYILKHPKKLESWQETLILFLIVIFYWANFFEKLTPDWQSPTTSHFGKIHPLANLSPTIFTITTIFLFVPRKYRSLYYTLVALMWPAMLVAGLRNALECPFTQSQWVYVCIIFDILGHLIISAFGFYLLRNNYVDFRKKNLTICISTIAFFVVLVIILNAILDTRFYGLNLNGKHHIYNAVIFKNSYVNAIVYVLGLSLILVAEVFLNKKLIGIFNKKKEEEKL